MPMLFESIMLICFGAAWPVSIHKSWTSRSTAGKSVLFLWIVETGYVSGIAYKLSSNPNAVVYLYLLNAVMVGTDIVLFYRNRRLGMRAMKEGAGAA